MERNQAVDIITKIAAQFPMLTGQAHKSDDGWTVQVTVPRSTLLEADTVDEARVLWRFLGRAGLLKA